jgi:hypothetical protein
MHSKQTAGESGGFIPYEDLEKEGYGEYRSLSE